MLLGVRLIQMASQILLDQSWISLAMSRVPSHSITWFLCPHGLWLPICCLFVCLDSGFCQLFDIAAIAQTTTPGDWKIGGLLQSANQRPGTMSELHETVTGNFFFGCEELSYCILTTILMKLFHKECHIFFVRMIFPAHLCQSKPVGSNSAHTNSSGHILLTNNQEILINPDVHLFWRKNTSYH